MGARHDILWRAALDRRGFLRGGLGALAAWGLAGSAAGRALGRVDGGGDAPGGGDEDGRALVLVQLTGGNDGLSTVVPWADDAYHRARDATRIAPGDVLRLDERRGLHPALGRLRGHWDAGRLAIVEGVGYPRPVRSHFESLDVWHAADPRGAAAGTGWVGRLCEEAFGDRFDPCRVVHVGARAPFALASGVHPPTAFASPAAFRLLRVGEALGALDARRSAEQEPAAPPVLGRLRRALRDARSASDRLRSAVEGYAPRAEYPDEPLGDALRAVAAILDAGVGARVLSVELTGFDTHADQRRSHDRRMASLDAALGAFLDDLAGSTAGRAAAILAFSEFGRRVAENGSRGTDHGTAGPVLVAGHGVRGGFHGGSPSLERLDEDGDLVHTTDFRSVYAALIEGLFEVPSEGVLGKRYPALELL